MRDDPYNSARTRYPTTRRSLPQWSPGEGFEGIGAVEGGAGRQGRGAGRPARNERDYRWVPDDAPPARQAGPAMASRPAERAVPAPPVDSSTATHPAPAGGAEEDPGYVIHLPVRVGSADSAVRLARAVAGALEFLPELDPGETTVSTVDDQNNRQRVFCDLLLPDRSRCPQRYAHRGPCGPVE